MEAYVRETSIPETIMYAHTSAVSVGEVLHVAGLGVLRAMTAGDADESIAYAVKGVFNFPITAAVTVAQGVACYWDKSANTIILTGMAEEDFYLGQSVSAGTAAGGYVDVEISNASNNPAALGNIAVHDVSGKFKAFYATIDLAVAALVLGDSVIIKTGDYTLTAACDISKNQTKIIGEGVVNIQCGVGADYGFGIKLGAPAANGSVIFQNLNIIHDDDATQQGILINNASTTRKIIIELVHVGFESANGDSIHMDHTVTTSEIKIYADGQGAVIEGPVNATVKHAGDKLRFSNYILRGGVVTSADDIDAELLLEKCRVLLAGVTGGHANQRAFAMDCCTETDADPNTYAGFITTDFAGSHTEVIWPAS